MGAPLTLAVPSKGRLYEQVQDYFADAGLAMKKAAGARGYRATLAGLPDVDVMLLSASEIAAALLAGDVHFGVTGEDLIREASPAIEGRVHLVKPLGFGHADVVVAVPNAWIDVATMADFDDVCAAFYQRHRRRLRIATKYVTLTRNFFAAAGIADYRIVESAGATEGAPAAGTAEAIVDITSTGTTLAANGLKVLEDGTILQSQAQLAASLAGDWNAAAREAAARLLSRLAARERAKVSLVLRVRLDGDPDATLAAVTAAVAGSVLSRPAAGNVGGEYALLVPRGALMEAVAVLRAKGCAEGVTAQEVDYVFETADPMVTDFTAAIGA
ncbi:MAG: ATP phosphoribosyltransferase [Alphaproteobacteria bacterium]|nr:ATP phosphoribosyltransferase [Alphaproteobacteria bacterium]MDE2014218.1 ATP phosphoribosyltransferase [Alphaproteobacteria bacterium]